MKNNPAKSSKSQIKNSMTSVSPEQRWPGFLFFKAGGYMSIRQKMITWLLLIAVAVVFSNSFFLYKHWMEAETAAVSDAESTAQALALSLSFAEESTGFGPIHKTPAKVQHLIEHVHSNLKEDIVMVDDKKKILGDAVPENVGKIFDHDKNNEVGQTIRDGITRTFIERSADFAAGFGRLLVIQVKSGEGEPVGALIIEYTSYYDKYRADVIDDLKTDLTTSFIVLFMALGIGYFIARNLTIPILRLKKASDEIAAGNLDVKVEVESRDELGDLAAAFNTMAALRNVAEEAVRESGDRFRKLFENSNDAIFIHTLTGEILDANPQAENMMGYPVAVLKTMPVPALHPPEELETSKKAFEETISKGSARLESRFLHSGGCLIDVEISARIVDREKGIIQGIVRDITERKRATDALKKSEARFRSYIELTGQLAWNADAEGKAVEDIPEWRAFTGQSEAQVKGHGWSEAIHPDDRERVMQIWLEAVGRKGKYEAEIRVRRHDGVYCDFLDRGVPLLDESGQIREWVGTAVDITERKKAEEALRSAHEELLKKSGRLEAFQQVAVNREMRMVEMKDEVNGLLERLGEPRKYAEVDSIKKR